MNFQIIIPWRGGCSYREAALDYVMREHWQPSKISTVITHAPDGPWCKARAIQHAIEHSSADVLVVADADVFVEDFFNIIDGFQHSCASWGVPHNLVNRLSESGTRRVLHHETQWRGANLEQSPYTGLWGGGIVVIRREVALDIPMDPRFLGWGQEDYSWGCALRRLAGGPWEGGADLVHLWHPEQVRETRKRGSQASWNLWNRYVEARDPEKMRELVEEGKRVFTDDQPTV